MSGIVFRGQTRTRSKVLGQFLRRIEATVPADLDAHRILDNYTIHKTPAINRWLLRHPRFHRHFPPASGSWLNLVERWFAELTTKRIRRGTHRSEPALEADIRDWIGTWNQRPKPFVWVKTADEILASSARLGRRIADMGH